MHTILTTIHFWMKLSIRNDTILRWQIGILRVRPHHIATFTVRIPREEVSGIKNIIRDTPVWASWITPLEICWESTFCHGLYTVPIGMFLTMLTLFVFTSSWTGFLPFSCCFYLRYYFNIIIISLPSIPTVHYFVIFFKMWGKRILISWNMSRM